MVGRYGFWNNKRYSLEKMTLRELVGAYFQYYAINVYFFFGFLSTYYALKYMSYNFYDVIAISVAIITYPLFWYLLHRNILHSKFLFKSKWTAKIWKRVHFDHHQDPHDLSVLFGALSSTLPTIFILTAPIGWWLDGLGGAAAAFASGLFTTCFYEFAHCIQHLSYKPKNKMLDLMKKRHMEHHFHDESGNFGITNFFWDHVFKTYYVKSERPKKSPTVHNLGYTQKVAETYPWVAELSGGLGPDNPSGRKAT